MKPRSRAGREASKARHRKALKTKRRDASQTASSTASIQDAEVARLTRELNEALEQQAATSEVLGVISAFSGELQRVFQSMLENATRLCDAKFGMVFRFDGDTFVLAAEVGTPPAFAEYEKRRGPFKPVQGSHLDRVMRTKEVSHTADYAAEGIVTPPVKLGGARSTVDVPMLRGNELIGVFSIYRQEVRPFTEKQIALVTNFAAQAVIAIENARLLNELREALEQQTATANVLHVINSSPGHLKPVFEAMLESATRICKASFGSMLLREGERLRRVAVHNAPPGFAEFHRQMPVVSYTISKVITRIWNTKQTVHIVDLLVDDPNDTLARFADARTLLVVPLLKDDELVGIFGIYRQEVRPFTDKQIALVTNFAAQAVIAIENARLLNELRQRTTDLTEALGQQTATSEVLQVISSSPGDLQPVFETMLANAVRICDAKWGNIHRWDGDALHLIAAHNTPPAFAETRGRSPNYPASDTVFFGRVTATKMVAHVADAAAERPYIERSNPAFVAAVELGGARTSLAVPMLKENELIGTLALARQEVRPFTDKQIELVKNFAAQAVIAIENARLLNELRQRTDDLTARTDDLTEALEQQTATSEVLQIISSSSGDLKPVFEAMLASAMQICDAQLGNCWLYDGDCYTVQAMRGAPPSLVEDWSRGPLRWGPDTGLGRLATIKQAVHIADVTAEKVYIERDPLRVATVEILGARTFLAVPILKDHTLMGAIVIYRREVRPFTEKQIDLVKNFAAQAVIAIENARLLHELRETTDQVLKLNQQLEHRVADQVGEIERMGRLRRFLPPQVADLIVASGTEKQLESHRREITALFCDLRGFTGFTESADAEDVIALLREYHAAVGEKIIKYSGTLERYAGDGVMVVFNDPVPVENPALQAVLMALEMREAIGALTETWLRWGHDIGFGIGIAHGFATLGTIGFEGRFDYAAIGTVSNVASRLCDEAKPGQILISPRVLTKVENAVTVEPVGEFALKGIRRPLAAYNVVAAAT